MTNNKDKAAAANTPKIEVLGLWGLLVVWIKVAAITAVIVLILKYVFGVPISI